MSVEGDHIYVADGPLWTSAGVTAGIDLALALIEADHGVDLARQVSRELVVYHWRPGGQSQFSALSQMEPESDRMRVARAFARAHLSEPLPLERLAEAARLSPRQFGYAFRRETGETPAKAIERLRTEAAHLRLQDGSEPVETIARRRLQRSRVDETGVCRALWAASPSDAPDYALNLNCTTLSRFTINFGIINRSQPTKPIRAHRPESGRSANLPGPIGPTALRRVTRVGRGDEWASEVGGRTGRRE